MAKVEHCDSTDENGVRSKSIGAAMNDLNRAYRSAIALAESNDNKKLVSTLTRAQQRINQTDYGVLKKICELQ